MTFFPAQSREPSGPTPGHFSEWRGHYLGVILAALVVRILWLCVIPVILESDCIMYDLLARNLAAGNGFSYEAGRPTVYIPVGAPFLFSLFYRAFGPHFLPVAIMNALMGVGSVAITMGLTRRWFGATAGFFAGFLLAFWPSQIEFVTVLATEPSFIFFMLAGWYAYPDQESPWFPRAILSGLLFAMASYIRPTAVLLPIVLSIAPVVTRRVLLRPALQASVTLLVIGMCLVPWAVRNRHICGEFVLSTHGGRNLWMGNNPDSIGEYIPPPAAIHGMEEIEADHYLGGLARSYIRQHPVRFVGRTLVKFVRLHERESIGIAWNITALRTWFSPAAIWGLKIFNNLYWWAALGLGLAGLVALARDRGVLAALSHPAVLVWGYFATIHAIVVIQDRYHFPIIPSIAALGGFFLVRRVEARRARVSAEATPAEILA
jgi:4-amino-4-deoxy-L-arabinose transferase-like glycosyltransferase